MPKVDTAEAERAQQTRPLPVFRYDPNAEGLRRWFGHLETEIMIVAWELEGKFTAKKVLDAMRQLVDGEDRAYTTIMTTCARLYEKGVFNRSWTGASYLYWTRETRDAFEVRQATIIAQTLDAELTRALSSMARGSASAKADAVSLLTPAAQLDVDVSAPLPFEVRKPKSFA